jgi:gliding motility-associated-like protein
MNRFYTFNRLSFFIFSFLFLANTTDTTAQCSTSIVAVRDTIACGESILLKQVGVGGASSDDFTAGTLSGLWAAPGGVSSGYTIGGPCGTNPQGGQHLWFGNGSPTPRTATTVPVDASCGGNICFDFRQETQSGTCDGPDQTNEGVYLQYKTAIGVWTTIFYFNPVGFPYTGWQNHCFAIPVAAQTTTTQFRWQQTNASGTGWDFWGIDNVNIATCAGYTSLWSGGNIPFGYAADSITVNPLNTTTYNLMYSNWIDDTCTAILSIAVDQPNIISSTISSTCTGSDTLDAQATITANCEYRLELWNYLPGGATQPGWSMGTSPQQYHNIDININGPLFSNYTMVAGANGTSISYLIPVTDGDVLDAIFTNMGTAADECMYRVYDSQNNQLTQQGFPGSIPVNYSTTVTCPATATYNYSWQNITSGGVSGLNNPNIQNPLATVAVTTQFQVTAYDSLHPQCIAIDTVTVLPNANPISATLSGDTLICVGDIITLNFTLVGGAPYDIDVVITPQIGIPTNAFYQVDQFGLQTNGNGAITFSPTQNTTYSILSLSDITGCPASVTDPTLTVIVKSIPNAGNSPITADFCANDITNYDLSTYLGAADNFGYWTPPGGVPITNGLNLNFDPQSNSAGVYTYTVDNAPCASDWATITVGLATPPNPGTSVNQVYCQNALAIDLATLLGTPDPNGVWTTPPPVTIITPPAGTATLNYDPAIDPLGTYTYTVSDPSATCPDESADVIISINALPTAAISSTNTNICLGESTCLDFSLTGVANFSIDLFDGTTVTTLTVDGNGNDLFGNCISVSPITTTTYSINSITDNNGCISFPNTSVTITVNNPPNAGVSSILNICSDDINIYPLQNELGGGQDLTGYWTVLGPLPNNPNFDYNPQIMFAGVYSYTVAAAPCPDAVANVTVNLITPPFSGIADNKDICINNYSAISPYDLNNLLIGPNTGGIWCAGLAGGVPIASLINPNTYGVGTFQFSYEVFGTPPCASTSTTVSLTINPEPVVNTFTSNIPTVSQGNPINLTVDMAVGTPPFTINITDNNIPSSTPSISINPPNMSGSTTVTPNVFPITTYSITSIIDGNGCSTTSALTAPVTVDPYPVINPFNTATAIVCYGTIPSVNMTLTQGEAPVTVSYIYNGVTYTEVIGMTGQVAPILVNIPLDTANLNNGANTITIISATDNSGEPSPNNLIPNPIIVTVNPNPVVTFTTSTPEICFGQPAVLVFGFLVGTADFSVDYRKNNIPQTPEIFNNSGTQNYTLTPDPAVGINTYNMIQVTDANGCVSPLNGTSPVTITVNPTPVIDITVSGANPICVGETSDLFFPVTSGTAPYNLSYLAGTTNSTANVDAVGNIATTGTTQPISPITTTDYTLVSVTDAKGCINTLTNSANLIVNELPLVDISGTTEICDQDVTQLYFDFTAGISPWVISYDVDGNPNSATLSNSQDSIAVSPSTTTIYTVNSVSDINCTTPIIDIATITVNPLPEVSITGGGSVCDDGSKTDVIITTTSGTPTFNIEYSVGINKQLISNIGYQYIINTNEVGIYTVTKATDSKGCIAKSISGSALVNVNPMPEANITAYPQPADISNPLIYFIDQSENHTSGVWNFGDGNTASSNFGKINHTYNDTGIFIVVLEVMTDSGCGISVEKIIIIDQAFTIFIPNAFTPNNDLDNDYFLPISAGVKEYDLRIYDRFGSKVFMTDKIEDSWDGKVNNSTDYASAGNYVYNIVIIDFNGKERVFHGSLMLIR